MNLDELQSVQSRERQSSGLQHLRPTFYADAAAFIEELQAARAEAVEAADDPFASPEVRRLTDDIETARQAVEALYERRVGKVVKMASIAAADMPVEDDGLTDEERALFETLVERITQNRERVLTVLDGDASGVSRHVDDAESVGDGRANAASEAEADSAVDDAGPPAEDSSGAAGGPAASPDGDGEPGSAGADDAGEGPTDGGGPTPTVDAADLMGGGGPSGADPDGDASATPGTDGTTGPDRTAGTDEHGGSGDGGRPGGGAGDRSPAPEGASGDSGGPGTAGESAEAPGAAAVPRTTVRITADVGEILGIDERSYHLSSEDVVTLPEANAEPLLQRDAAERLD